MEAANRAPGSLRALGARRLAYYPSYSSGSSPVARRHLLLSPRRSTRRLVMNERDLDDYPPKNGCAVFTHPQARVVARTKGSATGFPQARRVSFIDYFEDAA